ncbi:MAG: hypothetical protein Q8898_15430 [Bacillota bacterium]|nr:hypothetical protein [Bacillota bacterium]
MQTRFAVEASIGIEDTQMEDLLLEVTDCLEFEGYFFIYHSLEEALQAKELLAIGNCFEEFHPLCFLASGSEGPAFFDFGIKSKINGYYLLIEHLSMFTITGGESTDMEMAVYQFEEHLVFSAKEQNKTFYFIESKDEELIRNIAKAYGVEVSFFILDKCSK